MKKRACLHLLWACLHLLWACLHLLWACPHLFRAIVRLFWAWLVQLFWKERRRRMIHLGCVRSRARGCKGRILLALARSFAHLRFACIRSRNLGRLHILRLNNNRSWDCFFGIVRRLCNPKRFHNLL